MLLVSLPCLSVIPAEGWLKPCFQYYKIDHGHLRGTIIRRFLTVGQLGRRIRMSIRYVTRSEGSPEFAPVEPNDRLAGFVPPMKLRDSCSRS